MGTALCCQLTLAQGYPSKPVRLVLGYAPGGVADILARLVAQKMSDSLGQAVVVDNRPSAGGIVAGETVAKADPDGHTLLFMNSGNALSTALFKKLPFDAVRDFEPITTLGAIDFVVLVDKSSDIVDLKDFLTKATAHPAKYNIGTVNVGSGQHMSATLFKSLTGLTTPIIPYKTTPSLFSALKSKEIDIVFEVASPALGLLRSGEIRAIATSSSKRSATLPNVPTLLESGVKEYDLAAWNGLAAPAKTPKAIVDRLNREVNLVLAQADVRRRFQELGIEPRGGTPEDLRQLLASEIQKWTNLVTTLNIEKQ